MSSILEHWVIDAREQSLALIDDLDDQQLIGSPCDTVNPLLWEIGHVAWFQEKWILRHLLGRRPLHHNVDRLYDSAAIPHHTRWDLALPDRKETVQYAVDVRDSVLDALQRQSVTSEPKLKYFVKLAVFHEDMHTEAFTYTRQTLEYPPPLQVRQAPRLQCNRQDEVPSDHDCRIDVSIPGGIFSLGAEQSDEFVFDNEKWSHPVKVAIFSMARDAVTQSQFLEFVRDAGYERPELWSAAGWQWRQAVGAQHPLYWRCEGSNWYRRVFDEWHALEPNRPMMHVSYYEADAYCRWANRRLPTEAEWELAAAGCRDEALQRMDKQKRHFPWGDEVPTPETANLDWQSAGTIDVNRLPDSDSAFGCRQMIGNVWEWTASDFVPYPGFAADPYAEYSQPWFSTHQVLRGGCWATRGRLIRNTWRNFYTPDRRDVWAGFRTCALEG